ncbi:hypothetical protein O181_038680 [Austropuccinia psidii MF-1]|uniref:Peptidase A2 domain-containing protein n=1 Tax=Austropuccinia psidii MF-1 TaxID=1389203 RepID=A0A9Q3DDC9_9BASI|nr:hypothetical protein [Austropuccinia psidii MF-1]
MKKVSDQKFNLPLEEILTISPSFTDQLRFLSEKEKNYLTSMESINKQEPLVTPEDVIIDEQMHYACPLGMMDVAIGQEGYKIKALVDTGSELNIIPEIESIKAKLTMSALNMCLKVIGGHSTAGFGLSENTLLVLPSGEETKVHFFVVRGSVHTVNGRPFLA